MNIERRVRKLEEATPPQGLLVLSDKEYNRLLEEGWNPPEEGLVVILTSWA